MGDLSLVPPVPDYDNLLDLGTPDVIFRLTLIPLRLTAICRCMVIPNTLPEEKYITAAEFFPANKSAMVYCIVLYYDTLATAWQLDENDPGDGYTCFGSRTSITANMFAQWGPGGWPTIMPEGRVKVKTQWLFYYANALLGYNQRKR